MSNTANWFGCVLLPRRSVQQSFRSNRQNFMSSAVGLQFSVIGITLAVLMYLGRRINPGAIAAKIKPVPTYPSTSGTLTTFIIGFLSSVCVVSLKQVMEVDFRVVDGAVNLTGFLTLVSGEGLNT